MKKINICVSTDSGHIFGRLEKILDLDKYNVIFSTQSNLLFNAQNKSTRLNLHEGEVDYLFIKSCTIDKYGIDLKEVIRLIGHSKTVVFLVECGGRFQLRCEVVAEKYLIENNINYTFYKTEESLYDKIIEIGDNFIKYLKDKELIV